MHPSMLWWPQHEHYLTPGEDRAAGEDVGEAGELQYAVHINKLCLCACVQGKIDLQERVLEKEENLLVSVVVFGVCMYVCFCMCIYMQYACIHDINNKICMY